MCRPGRRGVIATAVLALPILLLHATAAPAVDRITVGVVSIGNALQWPLYVAIDKGFMAEQELDIEPIAGQSSPNLLRQISAGAVALGLPTAADAFRAIDKGAPVVVLRADTEHSPQVLMARPSIRAIADLKGRVVTVGAADGIDRFYLDEKLKAGGLAPGEYDAILGGGAANRFSALMSGAVDAAGISPPELYIARAAGYADLGTLDAGRGLPWTCLAAYRPWLDGHRSTALRYLAAYAKAVDWFNNAANRAEAAAILVKWGKGQGQYVEPTYDYYRGNRLFDPRGALAADRLAGLVTVLTQLKYITGVNPGSLFYDGSYLPEGPSAVSR